MLKGIILGNVSNTYQVEITSKEYNCIARGKFKQDKISPVVGDIVEIEITDKEKKQGVIEKILERENYVKRPKLSNLKQIVFVLSMKMPKPDLLLLDKQLAFAEFMKIKPIIVLNKIDLETKNLISEIATIYQNIGYTVIKTNAITGDGVEELKQLLKNNITAFSGNSGVGKSSLINLLLEKNIAQEGIISEKNKRGKNTTTSVKLYKLDKETYIADTPRVFKLFDRRNRKPKIGLLF